MRIKLYFKHFFCFCLLNLKQTIQSLFIFEIKCVNPKFIASADKFDKVNRRIERYFSEWNFVDIDGILFELFMNLVKQNDSLQWYQNVFIFNQHVHHFIITLDEFSQINQLQNTMLCGCVEHNQIACISQCELIRFVLVHSYWDDSFFSKTWHVSIWRNMRKDHVIWYEISPESILSHVVYVDIPLLCAKIDVVFKLMMADYKFFMREVF